MRGYWQRQLKTPEMTPDLWSTLPCALIDDIILRVLIDMPFSKLYSFCSFSKRWRDFLLSKTHYLFYFHMGKLTALNSRRGIWEEISLQFCKRRLPGLQLRNLRLVVSAGGLLCLSNTADGEYILCNPLTRCCKRLGKHRWRPSNRLEAGLPHTGRLGTRVVAYTTWPAVDTPNTYQEVITVYQSNITADVQLMLNTGLIDDQRKTIVHDYRRTKWSTFESVAGVQDGFRFYVDGPVMVSREQLALGFYNATHAVDFPASFNVLIYDLKQRRSGWLRVPQIPRRSRKQLVGTIGGENQLEFEEIRDTGHTEITFPPPLKKAFEDLMARISKELREAVIAGKCFEMVYVEQDGIVYLVAMVSHESNAGPYHVFAVWRHCRVNNSDLITECTAEWPNKLGVWPYRTSFHLFKPSLSCPWCTRLE